jgi:hypothetical protein
MEPEQPFDAESVAFLKHLQDALSSNSKQAQPDVDDEAERLILPVLLAKDPAGGLEAAAVFSQSDSLPTAHESRFMYPILAELAGQICEAIAEDRPIDEPRPLIGTLPLGWPTAILLRVPATDKHLVLVDPSFPTFANLLAKACAQALVPIFSAAPNEAWPISLRSGTHPGVRRFIELMQASLRHVPASAPQYMPDPSWEPLASQLRAAMEAFVLAEPYAHLSAGHCHQAPPLTIPAVHPQAESYLWSEQQRAEAFFLRLAIVASVSDRQGYQDKRLAYVAIHMLLLSVVLLEQCQATLRGEAVPEDTIAQNEFAWLRPTLLRVEGEESPTAALLDRLTPLAETLIEHLEEI